MSRLQTEDNSSKYMTPESRQRAIENQSKTMKARILNGEWTPCITNSWANSRVRIQMSGCSYKFRSTWEALFWLSNPSLKYENIRIPYYDTIKQKDRVYIVDFVDECGKTLYEIKPESNQNSQNCIDKLKGAQEFCDKLGYNFSIIGQKDIANNLKWISYDIELDIIEADKKLKKSLVKFRSPETKYLCEYYGCTDGI
jgi:hypothetical protein